MSRRARDRGFALLVVLWSVTLLALLATQLTATARTETRLAANLRANAMAEAAAEGGVREAVFRLLAGEAQRWTATGFGFATTVGTMGVVVQVEPVGGKLNPNTAPAPLLAALLRQLGAEPAMAALLAQAVVARRDPAQGGRPHGSLAALAGVPGMTTATLDALRPYLSVFNFAGIDPRLASPALARALAETGTQQEEGEDYGLIVNVLATAELPGAARFTRRAVVRLRQAAPLPPYQILAWE
jgi:general secretion pathway protein K